MYVNVYGRQPDTGGLAYWTDILDRLALTRGQVMVEFSSAEEYLSISANQVYVTMTYMGLLRRAPEQSGFDYWAEVMDGGASGLGLIGSFLLSDEYAARFDVDVDDDGDGYTENQGDCSDLDINTYPGATEVCGDSIDQDCNGQDEVCPVGFSSLTAGTYVSHIEGDLRPTTFVLNGDNTGLWSYGLEGGAITWDVSNDGVLTITFGVGEFEEYTLTSGDTLSGTVRVNFSKEPEANATWSKM